MWQGKKRRRIGDVAQASASTTEDSAAASMQPPSLPGLMPTPVASSAVEATDPILEVRTSTIFFEKLC